MKLEINGEFSIVPASGTVGQLLENLGVNPDLAAVELNRCIIRRRDWNRTPVRDLDKIEIVRFGSGG
jgi:thiamine biosynthesis protein ThiS